MRCTTKTKVGRKCKNKAKTGRKTCGRHRRRRKNPVRKRRTKLRKNPVRKCGTCRRAGHNSRTCSHKKGTKKTPKRNPGIKKKKLVKKAKFEHSHVVCSTCAGRDHHTCKQKGKTPKRGYYHPFEGKKPYPKQIKVWAHDYRKKPVSLKKVTYDVRVEFPSDKFTKTLERALRKAAATIVNPEFTGQGIEMMGWGPRWKAHEDRFTQSTDSGLSVPRAMRQRDRLIKALEAVVKKKLGGDGYVSVVYGWATEDKAAGRVSCATCAGFGLMPECPDCGDVPS